MRAHQGTSRTDQWHRKRRVRAAPSRPSTAATNDVPCVGILFVHGIGEQGSGDTLLGFGEPLTQFLDRWLTHDGTKPGPSVRVEDATLVDMVESGGPPHVRIVAAERAAPDALTIADWLLAEAWWARSFRAASFGEVAWFTLGVAPAILLRSIAQIFGAPADATKADKRGSSVTRFFATYERVMQAAMAFAAAVLLETVLVALMVVAIVPPLRGVATAAQRRVAGFVGDSYVLASSPLRRGAMVARVRRDLAWLAERCDAVVIVAHSQGAAVAHRALRAGMPAKVVALVTLGAGIGKLLAVEQLLARSGQLRRGVLLVGAGLLGLMLFFWARWLQAETATPTVVPALGLAGLLAMLVSWPLAFRALMVRVPSPSWEEVRFEGLGEEGGFVWLDLHAKRDLVPDGALAVGPSEPQGASTPSSTDGRITSAMVRNRDSYLTDHTTYFANPEEVLSRLVLLLSLVPDREPLVSTPEVRWGVAERTLRVNTLGSAGATTAYAGFAALLALGQDRLVDLGRAVGARAVDTLGLLFADLADALAVAGAANELGAFALGAATLIALIAAWHRLVVVEAWQTWDRAAVAAWFARDASHAFRRERILFALAGAALPVATVVTIAARGASFFVWIVAVGSLLMALGMGVFARSTEPSPPEAARAVPGSDTGTPATPAEPSG